MLLSCWRAQEVLGERPAGARLLRAAPSPSCARGFILTTGEWHTTSCGVCRRDEIPALESLELRCREETTVEQGPAKGSWERGGWGNVLTGLAGGFCLQFRAVRGRRNLGLCRWARQSPPVQLRELMLCLLSRLLSPVPCPCPGLSYLVLSWNSPVRSPNKPPVSTRSVQLRDEPRPWGTEAAAPPPCCCDRTA